MSVDPPQPLPPDPPPPSPFPRLSIRDWLVGTLLCGTMFMLMQMQRSAFEDVFDLPRPPPAFRFGHAAVWAAEAVVALTLLGLLVARRTVHGFYPGHWLCLYSALLTLSNVVPLPDWAGAGGFSGVNTYRLQASLTAILLGAAVFSPAFLTRPPLLWLIYFRLAFGLQITRLLFIFRGESELNVWILRAEGVFLFGAALTFLVVFVAELIRHRRLDWAHWVGVFSPAAHFVLVQIEKLVPRG